MLMSEIYLELEKQLKEADEKEHVLREDEEKITKEIEEMMDRLSDIQARHEIEKNNVAAIMAAMENLATLGNFRPTEEAVKKAEAEKQAVKIENEKNLVWKHKNAVVVKYGRDGGKLGTYRTQTELAKQLGVSPSTVCNFMKKNEKLQLKERGFYLRYEY